MIQVLVLACYIAKGPSTITNNSKSNTFKHIQTRVRHNFIHFHLILWMVAKSCTTNQMVETPTKQWDVCHQSTGAGFRNHPMRPHRVTATGRLIPVMAQWPVSKVMVHQ
jgi:hypothetical protein